VRRRSAVRPEEDQSSVSPLPVTPEMRIAGAAVLDAYLQGEQELRTLSLGQLAETIYLSMTKIRPY
jgi:hypothetical protein